MWEGKREKRAGAMMESFILWIFLLELAARIIFVAFAPTWSWWKINVAHSLVESVEKGHELYIGVFLHTSLF